MIRTLAYGAVVAMTLAWASCARNTSHEAHADHEPAKKVELEQPAAPVPVIVEPEAAAPAPAPAPIEPNETIAEKKKAKPKPVRRPKPAVQVKSEERRPAVHHHH